MANELTVLGIPAQITIILQILKERNPGAQCKVAAEYNSDGTIEYSAWIHFPGAMQFPGNPIWLLVASHRTLSRLREAIEHS